MVIFLSLSIMDQFSGIHNTQTAQLAIPRLKLQNSLLHYVQLQQLCVHQPQSEGLAAYYSQQLALLTSLALLSMFAVFSKLTSLVQKLICSSEAPAWS